MFEKISHTMFYVTDLNRAVKWYTDKLGCKVNFQAGPHYASLRLESVGYQIDLHPTEANSKDVGFGPMLYFASKNLDKTIVDLKEKGIKVGEPKSEGDHRFVTFWDSEGNALGVQQL